MAAWSVVFTPFYVALYKMYDRYLPKKTPATVAARVGLSLLCSLPINFAFYAYGTTVEHVAAIDWFAAAENNTTTTNPSSFRFEELFEKTKRKLEAEFVTTVTTSAK